MIFLVIRLLVAIVFAFLAGKLIAKLKLPSILGWLIAGMVLEIVRIFCDESADFRCRMVSDYRAYFRVWSRFDDWYRTCVE